MKQFLLDFLQFLGFDMCKILWRGRRIKNSRSFVLSGKKNRKVRAESVFNNFLFLKPALG